MKDGDDGTIEGKAEKVSVSQEVRKRMDWLSLMKQQFVGTHTVRQNGFLALVDSWVTDISRQLGYRYYWTVGLQTLMDSWVTDISGQLGYRH